MNFLFFATLCLLFPLLDFAQLKTVQNKVLSRRRRYLTFPEGASLTAAACLTTQLWVNPPGIFTETLAWGLVYDLPNDTKTIRSFVGPIFLAKRRHRRELYGKMERIMESLGYNGRVCVLRTVCEASHRFLTREDNLLNYILKTIFNFPRGKILPTEPEEHRIYHLASRLGEENSDHDCSEIFKCPFSLIDVALGHYSNHLD